MAKGDGTNKVGSTTPGATNTMPKMDQYSVMHRMFDHFSPNVNQGITPSNTMGGPMTSMPMNRDNGAMAPNGGYNVMNDIPGGGYTGMAPRFGSSDGFNPNFKQDSNNVNGLTPDINQLMQQLFGNGPIRKMI